MALCAARAKQAIYTPMALYDAQCAVAHTII